MAMASPSANDSIATMGHRADSPGEASLPLDGPSEQRWCCGPQQHHHVGHQRRKRGAAACKRVCAAVLSIQLALRVVRTAEAFVTPASSNRRHVSNIIELGGTSRNRYGRRGAPPPDSGADGERRDPRKKSNEKRLLTPPSGQGAAGRRWARAEGDTEFSIDFSRSSFGGSLIVLHRSKKRKGRRGDRGTNDSDGKPGNSHSEEAAGARETARSDDSPQSQSPKTNHELPELSSAASDGFLPVSDLFYRSPVSTTVTPKSFFTRKMSLEGSKQGGDAMADDAPAGASIRIEEEVSSSELVRTEIVTMVEQELEERCQMELWMQNQTSAVADCNETTAQSDGECLIDGETLHQATATLTGGISSRDSELRNGKKARLRSKSNRSAGRKMVRRGMEMLVGGELINADPPQRAIELNYYRKHPKLWARAITTNSPDFGPLLYMHSASQVVKESVGVFCEEFVDAAQKWKICPDDLVRVTSEHKLQSQKDDEDSVPSVPESEMEALITAAIPRDNITNTQEGDDAGQTIISSRAYNDTMYDEYGAEFGIEAGGMQNAGDGGLVGGSSDPYKGRFGPYNGRLGPRLVDAAVERARQSQPRVIVIGDVHGCIDELQALLRKCDYHPGDAIVFLGDLVCKGPDSLSVVQMAREVGALGVRGNHDFEVIRWHQAIESGADPPAIGSEHYHVATALSTDDLKWMHSLPWFMSSSHLNALFVHAGFVSGIRLAKQNPRLMMNMRSILPDGTVTSKFFNNWPWARLWDGPQTVFFGHDADRGLQQYEHAIGLDTGCVYGGKLTACILPERRLVSVNAKREYFQYRRKHFD